VDLCLMHQKNRSKLILLGFKTTHSHSCRSGIDKIRPTGQKELTEYLPGL
jgi:hypothetical protein